MIKMSNRRFRHTLHCRKRSDISRVSARAVKPEVLTRFSDAREFTSGLNRPSLFLLPVRYCPSLVPLEGFRSRFARRVVSTIF